MMRKAFFALFLCVFLLPAEAQIRGNEITVTVTPDHKDWNYRVGEKANFVVNVLRSGTLIDNALVDYEAGPEMYPDVKKQGVTLKNGSMRWTGTMKKPGFYRLKVTAHVGGKDYSAWCTAAFNPEQLRPTTENPSDFDEFWSKAIADARNVPLQPSRRLLPERCTEEVNVYEVNFQNVRWGSRTYGILCIPTKPGKYPALLRVPGAGVRPYEGDKWIASKGCVTLEIGIHGIPVTMQQQVYDDLRLGGLDGYWDFNMNDRKSNYYYRVVLGCIRAIDYIETLPEWNHQGLGVTGSSQGGFLSYACAGLDKRVTCYGAVHAALCDLTASLKGVACGWPHYFYGVKNPDPKKVEVSRYYDGVNFARRISCPGYISFGYNDDVVPPTTAYGTYNELKAEKKLSVYQQTAHFWYQEQWDEWNAWLCEKLGIK